MAASLGCWPKYAAVDPGRLGKSVGYLNFEEMRRIDAALRIVLDLLPSQPSNDIDWRDEGDSAPGGASSLRTWRVVARSLRAAYRERGAVRRCRVRRGSSNSGFRLRTVAAHAGRLQRPFLGIGAGTNFRRAYARRARLWPRSHVLGV